MKSVIKYTAQIAVPTLFMAFLICHETLVNAVTKTGSYMLTGIAIITGPVAFVAMLVSAYCLSDKSDF